MLGSILSLVWLNYSSLLIAGEAGPPAIDISFPELQVYGSTHGEYGRCVHSIPPWFDFPGWPPSEHHDVYFDIYWEDNNSCNIGEFYRGFFPRSQLLAIEQAKIELLAPGTAPNIPGITGNLYLTRSLELP